MENKVVSFDIFDTLLLRPYIDPQEIWSVLEEREGAKGFAKARKVADKKTYDDAIAHGGETSLESAYSIMPDCYAPMMQKEMDLERSILSPNPEMIQRWNLAKEEGKRRVLISDMYMPRTFVEDVLVRNGITGWDALYLSSDRGVRKSSGKLYELMLKEQGVLPEEVLHIGDNMQSDVSIPHNLGMQVAHFRKISEQFFEICPFAQYIDRTLSGHLALGWHLYKCETKKALGIEPSYWNRIGFTMGGVLGYMYVSWIGQVAKERGINRLLFVARDGYIWQKICNELFPEIKTDYIFAPRITSIAVLGATGNDPIAIRDRQNYIDKHLQRVDRTQIRQKYCDYILPYGIDEHTAIVDGCSSGFSAQRLIEECVGHRVFAFYLATSAKKSYTASLFSTNHYTLPFQHFTEFLFSAPEKPIQGIVGNAPIYQNEVSSLEQQKMDVSEELCDGSIACAKLFMEHSFSLLPGCWIQYSDQFMRNLTDEDYIHLIPIKNAGDVEQQCFNSILWTPISQPELRLSLISKGHLKMTINTKNSYREIHLSKRGIKSIHKDMSISFHYIIQ